jgi:hypothetical protein
LRAALFGLAFVYAGVGAQEAAPPKIVCWTDDHGARACGDHVPAEFAQKQRKIYDSSGTLVQTIAGQLTAEQRAAQAQKELQEKQVQGQQDHDTFLIQSYRSTADLEAERDSRIAALETRLELAEKSVADGEHVLTDLNARAAEEKAAGKDVDPALARQIQTFEAAHADDQRAVTELQRRRDALASQYERDIQRFVMLSAKPH